MFATDPVLQEAVARKSAGWACSELEDYGRKAGSAEPIEWGVLANEYPPVLQTHDRYGRRRDEVEFHPAWRHLMRLAMEHGIHSMPWAHPRPGAHIARAALAMLVSENEAGHICPISMTYAAVPVLPGRQLERVLAEIRLAKDARVERFLANVHADVAESGARRTAWLAARGLRHRPRDREFRS